MARNRSEITVERKRAVRHPGRGEFEFNVTLTAGDGGWRVTIHDPKRAIRNRVKRFSNYAEALEVFESVPDKIWFTGSWVIDYHKLRRGDRYGT